MAATWNLLVVDDDDDIHHVTRIALRRKTWRGRSIALTHARSAEEAKKVLASAETSFHGALVDVVMESRDAGLELCDFIRREAPRTLRVILRTGQPGAAPLEKVLSDYDIDYYLSKTEVTEERLFSTVRACFRSSQDVAILTAVGQQLRAFTVALQEEETTRGTLVDVMTKSLAFLEEKYSAKVLFVDDAEATSSRVSEPAELRKAADAIRAAHDRRLEPIKLISGPDVDLPTTHLLMTASALKEVDRAEASLTDRMKRWLKTAFKESDAPRKTGVVLAFEQPLPERWLAELEYDLELFVSNWRVAESSLRLGERLLQARLDVIKEHGRL